jgi:hypothetical protein
LIPSPEAVVSQILAEHLQHHRTLGVDVVGAQRGERHPALLSMSRASLVVLAEVIVLVGVDPPVWHASTDRHEGGEPSLSHMLAQLAVVT